MAKKILAVLLPLLFMGIAARHASAVLIIGDGNTSSASSQSPSYNSAKYNPSSGYPGTAGWSGNIAPYYVVGNNKSQYNFANTQVKLYLQSGSTMSLSVNNAGPNCHNWFSGSLTGPDYAQNASNGGPTTVFSVLGAGGYTSSKTATPYDDCQTSMNFSLSSANAYTDPNGPGGYTKYFWLNSSIPQYETIQGENSWWISANTTSGNAALGYSDAWTGYGYRAGYGSQNNINDGNYWSSDLLVAPNQTCTTLGQNQTGTINYADMDANNTSWNPAITLELQERPISGTTWSTRIFRDYNYLLSNESGTLYSGTFDPSYVYRVVIQSAGVKNTVFIQFQGNISAMAAEYHLTGSDCAPKATLSCTESPATTAKAGNQSIITLTGSVSSGSWPSSYFIKRTGPSYKQITAAGVNSGTDYVYPTAYTIYTYVVATTDPTLSQNGLAGGPAINSTSAHCPVAVGQPPPTYGSIAPTCNQTTITLITKAVDWIYVYTYHGPGSGGYFTQQAPDLGSDTWSFVPLPDPAPPPAATPGSDYTGPDPLFPGITSTWYWYGTLRSQQFFNPADEIPYYVVFQDANTGATVGQSPTVAQPDSGGSVSFTISTFRTLGALTNGQFLWPQNSYTATLYAEVQPQDSFQKDTPSSYGDFIAINQSPVPVLDGSAPYNGRDTCLHESIGSVCQNGSTINLEVGQSSSVQYTIQLINDTDKTFSSGYTMTIYTSGGLQLNDSTTKTVTVPGGPGPVNITGSWNVISNFNGSYSISFGFNGTSLASQIDPYDWGANCPLGPPVATSAHTLPYFQVWWGDIRAGGGFASPSGSPSTKIIGSCGGSGDPVYISPAAGSPGGSEAGGIRAFARASSRLGSQVDFGALAMGSIDGSAGGPIGFFSGDGVNGNPAFANTTGQMGGYLNGSAPLFCQKDFFDDTQSSPAPSSGDLQTDINSCSGRCQYISNTGMTIGGASLPAGKQVTLYVDGDVTIAGNINYPASFSTANQTDIPYLTIIANGNIKLTAGVTHLDGLYIAQPTNSGNGIFETCNDVCTSQLVINGAVIAQHLELLRSYGTLDQPPSDVNGVGSKPAEIINYVPSMVLGAPAFAAYYGQTEGLFSLAPVF